MGTDWDVSRLRIRLLGPGRDVSGDGAQLGRGECSRRGGVSKTEEVKAV